MQAFAVTPGRARSARLTQLPDPRPARGDCLARVLEVGIDGTDREIDAGEYGEAPVGEDLLVIGHESVAEIVEAPQDSHLRAGDLVVATVRRPCPQLCHHCRTGEVDFCSSGDYRERGIKGLHGYLAEAYAERPEFLVQVPDELRAAAVLLEPMSIVEKVFRQTYAIQERMRWQPQRVILTGAGSVGILAAMLARLRKLDTLIYSRGPAEGARANIMRDIGAEYRDAKRYALEDVAREFGAPDLVIEATGYSPLAWKAAEVLDLNGVACLLSVTGGEETAEIPSDELNREFVLGNRLLFGSVNAHRLDFESGIASLRAILDQWPDALGQFITRRLPLSRADEAMEQKEKGELKTVIEVAG